MIWCWMRAGFTRAKRRASEGSYVEVLGRVTADGGIAAEEIRQR